MPDAKSWINVGKTYRRHSRLSLEPSPDSVVDTLGFAPICVDTFVGIALVPVEALRAYKARSQRTKQFLHIIRRKSAVEEGYLLRKAGRPAQ